MIIVVNDVVLPPFLKTRTHTKKEQSVIDDCTLHHKTSAYMYHSYFFIICPIYLSSTTLTSLSSTVGLKNSVICLLLSMFLK